LPTNATEKMKELLNRDVDAWVAAADAFFEKVISKSILNYFKDKVLDIWNYCFSEDEDIFSMSEEIEEVIEYYLFALKKVDMANMENQRNHIHKQLGILYWQSKNFLAAVEHFNLAGETGKIGTKNSWWTKGNANYKKKDFHKSVECYKIALLLSNPAIKEDKQLIRKVLFILGKIYWEGHGNFLPNYQIAFEYFGKASRAGSTRAIDLLSNDKIGVEGFYLLGLKAYGKGNIDLAVKYWHSALPYGYALLALAKCYLIGIGVEKNIQLACLCFTNIIELNNRTNRHIEPAIIMILNQPVLNLLIISGKMILRKL